MSDEIEITELVKFEVERIDGVASPANGFPVLMMKGLGEPEPFVKADGSHPPFTGTHGHSHPAFGGPDGDGDGDHAHAHSHDGDADHHHSHASKAADREAAKALAKAILSDLTFSPAELWKAVGKRGQVDEAPDIELGGQILALLGQAMAAEAQEVAAGNAGEVCDIMELACAAQAVRCWRDGEQAVSLGDVMPASMLMQSAMPALDLSGDLTPEQWTEWAAKAEEAFTKARWSGWGEFFKAKHSAADRRALAEQGNALSDGSYPIADEEDLKSAAILAQSGHGDVDGAKRLISRRAKELGVKNPLDNDSDDASKAQIAKEEAHVDTVTQGSDDLDKAVADAVTKATASLRDELSSVREELAKVKATPVPGGPVMSAAAAVRKPAGDGEDHAAKATYYDEWAERISDPVESDRYRQLAARERAKITAS